MPVPHERLHADPVNVHPIIQDPDHSAVAMEALGVQPLVAGHEDVLRTMRNEHPEHPVTLVKTLCCLDTLGFQKQMFLNRLFLQ